MGYAGDFIHSDRQTLAHLEAEMTDDLDTIVDSLLPDGNGDYTWVLPAAPGGGHAFLDPADTILRVEGTRAGIRQGYRELHDLTAVLHVDRTVQLNGSFYSFINTTVDVLVKPTGDIVKQIGLAVFPTVPGTPGIRGEIMWGRTPESPSVEQNPGQDLRIGNLRTQNELIDAYRAGDAEQLGKLLTANTLLGVRDYVGGTEKLTNLQGPEAIIGHYSNLFRMLRVVQIDVVQRIVDDWYSFAELRWQVEIDGRSASFSTAEYSPHTTDHRIRALLGHGTPIAVEH